MKIVRARIVPLGLSLAQPLASAHGDIRERSGALLEIVDERGTSGFGEALPLQGFGLETAEAAAEALGRIAAALLAIGRAELETLLDCSDAAAPNAKSARAAADIALHDLHARTRGLSVARSLAESAARRVAVSALVAGATPAAAVANARHALTLGHRTLKLKLGSDDLGRDLERTAAVRAAIGERTRLRLDANGAWNEVVAHDACSRFAAHDIEFIEQPVAADDLEALARVRSASPIPIAVDESAGSPAAAEAIFACKAADVVIVKPAAVGGLRAAGRIAAAAARADVVVVVTSFLDSSLGIAAALQFAALPGNAALAAGLATAPLLADDLCSPLPIEAGGLNLPAEPGLGVRPDERALAKHGRGREIVLE